MKDDLEPCPFCGDEATFDCVSADSETHACLEWSPECQSCGATIILDRDCTKAEARAAWNTRPQSDRITALEAQLATARRDALEEARPLEEWYEDHGNVVWWKFPVSEPSWIGTPLDSDWPDYHTHWTPHPPIPAIRTLMDKTDAE